MQTANKKVINGWAMYDWANSVYNLVITTTFFPIYFLAVTQGNTNGIVTFLGRKFQNSALYNYTTALAYLLVAISSPVLSSIADTRGNKKNFLIFFTILGSLSCSALYNFNETNLSWGVIFFLLATMGYCGGLVFYNSYLPEIAAPEDRDRVSAKGFAMGYIGSVLMQLVGFALVTFKPFGMTDGKAVQFTFLLVGIWWLGFALITFKRLPASRPVAERPKGNAVAEGIKELKKVYAQVKVMPVLKRFLRAFFFYSMGVQTVMLAATVFGSKVLNLESSILIATVVAIQVVAVFGAWAMARLSGRFGNMPVLVATVILWILICIMGYRMKTPMDFYILACAVGLVMGGIQSLSRSTYAKLMPETHDTASFFSYYDVTEKIAIVIGMASFAYIDDYTKDIRNSVLALVVFFVIGLIWLISALLKQRQLNQENVTSVKA